MGNMAAGSTERRGKRSWRGSENNRNLYLQTKCILYWSGTLVWREYTIVLNSISDLITRYSGATLITALCLAAIFTLLLSCWQLIKINLCRTVFVKGFHVTGLDSLGAKLNA